MVSLLWLIPNKVLLFQQDFPDTFLQQSHVLQRAGKASDGSGKCCKRVSTASDLGRNTVKVVMMKGRMYGECMAQQGQQWSFDYTLPYSSCVWASGGGKTEVFPNNKRARVHFLKQVYEISQKLVGKCALAWGNQGWAFLDEIPKGMFVPTTNTAHSPENGRAPLKQKNKKEKKSESEDTLIVGNIWANVTQPGCAW